MTEESTPGLPVGPHSSSHVARIGSALRLDPIVGATSLILVAMPIYVTQRLLGPINGPDAFWHLALASMFRAWSTWLLGRAETVVQV
jgi:hypothetical protein